MRRLMPELPRRRCCNLYDFAPYFGAALARHALCVAFEEFARRTPRAMESGRGEQRSVP